MSARPNPVSRFDKSPAKNQDELSYKEQLDQAAIQAREPEKETQTESVVNPLIEKVTEYIPSAAKVLGNPKQEQEEQKESHRPGADVPGPPERPSHDYKIEEFVREQHRSKGENGVLQ